MLPQSLDLLLGALWVGGETFTTKVSFLLAEIAVADISCELCRLP